MRIKRSWLLIISVMAPCIITSLCLRTWIYGTDAVGNCVIRINDDATQMTQLVKLENSSPYQDAVEKIIRVLEYNADGTRLAIGSWENVRLWDAQKYQELHQFEGIHGIVSSIAYSVDGKFFAFGDQGNVYLWDLVTNSKLATFASSDYGWVDDLVFSLDSNILAAGNESRTVKFWNTKSLKLVSTVSNGYDVYQIGLSPDGKTLVSGGDGRDIKAWDLSTWQEKPILKKLTYHGIGSIEDLVYLSDKIIGTSVEHLSGLAGKAYDYRVRVWDALTDTEYAYIVDGNDPLRLSLDGRFLAYGTEVDNKIRLLDVPSCQAFASIKDVGSRVYTIAFSPDNSILVSGHEDGSVYFWRIPQPKR